LFERGGVNDIFAHGRNLVTATLIVAAGMHVTSPDAVSRAWGILNLQVAGYTVAAFGLLLLVLNLIDGLHKLAKARRHVLLQALLMIAYLLISVRVAQLVIAFRGP
jgi:hypothetical protein